MNRGEIGYAGCKGDVGLQGERGCIGPVGSTGVTGSAGFAGATGRNGATGATGLQESGATGQMGPTGNVGPTAIAQIRTAGYFVGVDYTLSAGTPITWSQLRPDQIGTLFGNSKFWKPTVAGTYFISFSGYSTQGRLRARLFTVLNGNPAYSTSGKDTLSNVPAPGTASFNTIVSLTPDDYIWIAPEDTATLAGGDYLSANGVSTWFIIMKI